MHITIILGAGASFASGCPLLSNFLEVSRNLALSSELSPDGIAAYALTDKACELLQRCNIKSRMSVNNIEAVMSALEMAMVSDGIAEWSPRDTLDAYVATKRLIAMTLIQKQKFYRVWSRSALELLDQQAFMQSTELKVPDYSTLTDGIARLLDQFSGLRVTVISFNYDIGFDIALANSGIVFSYPGVASEDARVTLCKPHGSLNWFAKSDDSAYECIPPLSLVESIQRPNDLASLLRNNRASVNIPCKLDYSKISLSMLDRLVIVPPSDSKADSRGKLSSVWKAAASGLKKSIGIYLCGYSIPESDRFFRMFFAIAMASDTRIRQLHIGDPDHNPGARLRQWLNESTVNDSVFMHLPMHSGEFFKHVIASVPVALVGKAS